MVNFSEEDPIRPQGALAELRSTSARLPVEELAGATAAFRALRRFSTSTPGKMLEITPLIRERIKLLSDVVTVADFFFVEELPPYDRGRTDPAERRCAQWLWRVLREGREVLATSRIHARRRSKSRCGRQRNVWA